MMKPQTIEQLLLVFRLFRERHAGGEPLRRSYREAVREVADLHSVTYQTIGDGCRRRLQLNKIEELFDLLQQWVEGNPEPLAEKLKAASDYSAHDNIGAFFESSASSSKVTSRPVAPVISDGKLDSFSFRLPERDSRMLRALAEIEGISIPEMLGQLVRAAVAERMKSVAQRIIHDSGIEANKVN